MFKIKSILALMVLGFIVSVGVNFILTNDANAQVCDAWVDYMVDEDGNGTCTVGLGATDFLNGTGVAKCSFARNGNINCKCEGEHEILLEFALVFNRTDMCCIFIGADPAIESDLTSGLGTPSGIVNATCHYRP